MARKPSSSSRNTAANRRSQSAGSGKPGTRKGRNPRAQKAADAKRDSRKLIDEYAKRDIVGIAFTVAAVVLFIAAVMRSDAIVTSFISSALHLTLGIGAYILPLFLLAIGITFLIRFEAERVPTRVAVGLGLVFVALLAVFALATPLPEGGDPAGILFNDKLYGLSNYDFESAYHAMNSLLARRAEFTALFAMSDVIAFGAIRALVSAGFRVPEDVSVIGFDGITMSRYCVPVMTTIVQPSEQIALQSIELLVRQIEHGAPAQTVTLQPELQQGESVCPCRRNDSV